MNAGKENSRSNGYTSKKLIHLLGILDSKGDVMGHNMGLLIVMDDITSKLKVLSA